MFISLHYAFYGMTIIYLSKKDVSIFLESYALRYLPCHTSQWRPGIPLQVYLVIWGFLWVLAVTFLFLTLMTYWFVCPRNVYYKRESSFYSLWVPSKNEILVRWYVNILRKFFDITIIRNSIMSGILVPILHWRS